MILHSVVHFCDCFCVVSNKTNPALKVLKTQKDHGCVYNFSLMLLTWEWQVPLSDGLYTIETEYEVY